MSAAPRDERIQARTQLKLVADALYANGTEALSRMRRDAHLEGAASVQRKLEEDFTCYGEAHPRVAGPTRERAVEQLREHGLAGEIGKWLSVDHPSPEARLVSDAEIERSLAGPDAEVLGRAPREPAPATAIDPRFELNEQESIAYAHLEAYAAAKERADQRTAAEARLHDIYDHRANLDAAESKLPAAREALQADLDDVCRDGETAMDRVARSMEQRGPADTAREIRRGALLNGDLKPINRERRWLLFAARDRAAEKRVLERLAQRVETLGYYEGDIGKWSTFRPENGPVATGAKNVRAALDREEAKVLADSDLGPIRRQIERSRPAQVHPSVEASRLERVVQRHLEDLPPVSRERVLNAAGRSGSDRMGAAMGHLQTLQMAARTFREGIEGPGH